MKKIFLSIMTITVLGFSANAQNYTEITTTSFVGVNYGAISFVDIDNDNDQDVLITGEDSLSVKIAKLYINDGSGSYTEVIGTPFEGVKYGSISIGDIDNDNDQDILITGENSSNIRIAKLYVNDGNGTYTEVIGTPFEGVSRGSVKFVDINNDNDLDLLITGVGSLSSTVAKLYTNDGSGNFTEVLGTIFDNVQLSAVAFSDIDSDGDQDVIITGYNGSQASAKLYTNDGNGNYTEVIGTNFQGVQESSVAFSDIDNDGDQDILLTGYSFGEWAILYTNDGNGNYTEVTGTPFDGVRGNEKMCGFADVDNDNDQDILITGWGGIAGRISKLYANDGSGNYTEVTGAPFIGISYSSIAFTDIDNDNDQDLMIVGYHTNGDVTTKLYRNMTTSVGVLENINFPNLSIFPNPATSQITINSDLIIKSIEIMDVMGKTIKTLISSNNTIDISYLTKGIYFLQLQTSEGLVSKKIIKE